MDPQLRILIATLRSRGGKVSTNVVSGHNVTAPDGSERRFANTRATYKGQPTPNLPDLVAHLREITGGS